jgi:hypothetical protein
MTNNIDIPAFLIEMSEQINTQDNRITAEPIWQVCYDKEHVTAEGYESYTTYCNSDDDYILILSTEDGTLADNDYAIEWLREHKPNFCEKWELDFDKSMDDFDFEEEFDNYEMNALSIQKNYMVRRMEVVKSCLTESDAKWFIQRKQHDYPKLYTYVESMVFCPQMIELRNWIKSLTEASK